MTAALFLMTACCGCATLFFKPLRHTTFIDTDGQRLHVEYGKEKRTETLPSGVTCTFEGKVRVQLPTGKKIVLYQTMTVSGVRYHSSDKRYEFREMGPYCVVSKDREIIFEGVYCGN